MNAAVDLALCQSAHGLLVEREVSPERGDQRRAASFKHHNVRLIAIGSWPFPRQLFSSGRPAGRGAFPLLV
jgi:hypothetical protein